MVKQFVKKLLRSEGRFYYFSIGLYLILSVLLFIIPRKESSYYIDKKEAWNYIVGEAQLHNLNPEFIYSIALAESNLNAYARGMMQMSKVAWKTVSKEPYGSAYNWKTNVSASVAYMAYLRKFLEKYEKFNYERLAAAYRYGPNYLKRRKFSMKAVKKPKNNIYRQLFESKVIPAPY